MKDLRIVLVGLLLFGAAPGVVWGGQAITNIQSGTERSIITYELLQPFNSSANKTSFVDLRVRDVVAGPESAEYNLGIGHRFIEQDQVFGLYGYYDQLHSPFNNTFDQTTIGGELFRKDHVVRGNLYQAEDRSVTLATNYTPIVEGTDLQLRRTQAVERPLDGLDVEVGTRLDGPVWVYGQYFHFDEQNVDDIDGYRLRSEARLDADWLSKDAELAIGGEWQHDTARGEVGFATFRFSIPFGDSPKRSDNWKRRRLVERPERDIDIVTEGFTEQETVPPKKDDDTLSTIVFAQSGASGTGTQNDPAALRGALDKAGTNGMVVVLGDEGSYVITSPLDVRSGQSIVGGGGKLRLKAPDGTPVTFEAPGDQPVLKGPDGSTTIDSVLRLEGSLDDVSIRNLTINGEKFGTGTTLIELKPESDGAIRDVELKNLELKNIPRSAGGNQATGGGIAEFGDKLVRDITITNSRFDNEPTGVSHNGTAITIDTVNGLTIANNTIINASAFSNSVPQEKGAISLNDANRTGQVLKNINVDNNTIRFRNLGDEDVGFGVQGIYISSDRNAPSPVARAFEDVSVTDNTITGTDIEFGRPAIQAYAVAEQGADPFVVRGNELSDDGVGVRLRGGELSMTGNTIDTTGTGLLIERGSGTVENNTFDATHSSEAVYVTDETGEADLQTIQDSNAFEPESAIEENQIVPNNP